MNKLLLILPILLISHCECAKILYLMPFTAKSHYTGMKPLALALAQRGHDVYTVTAYREENHPPTYHQLMVEPVDVWSTLFPVRPNIFTTLEVDFCSFQAFFGKIGFLLNELVFNSTDVQNFMKEDHKIDLVISEVFVNELFYMFAHKYQAPLVLVTTFGNSFKTNYYTHNPLQLSTAYHEYGISSDPLSFVGRLRNVYFTVCDLYLLEYWYMPRQQELVRFYFKDLPEPVPSLKELAANAALVLMNSHFTVDTSLAYLPNFIEVGGMHISENNKKLPEDLQKKLDEAQNGVVYLSFGSNVRSSELSKDKLDAFLKVFGELKQTVLMKWEDTRLPNIPKNVLLRNWFPQKEILAHPNIRLFIAHGGWLGLQEAITAGVPIIGVPIFGDQYVNILDTVKNGFGELLEYKDITEQKVRELVTKVLSDEKYLRKAKEVSTRFKDRPMPPLETAVWWTEYVLRHKGADFMKTPAIKMNYFARNMLDVYLFILFAGALLLYVIQKTVSTILKLMRKPLSGKTKTE